MYHYHPKWPICQCLSQIFLLEFGIIRIGFHYWICIGAVKLCIAYRYQSFATHARIYRINGIHKQWNLMFETFDWMLLYAIGYSKAAYHSYSQTHISIWSLRANERKKKFRNWNTWKNIHITHYTLVVFDIYSAGSYTIIIGLASFFAYQEMIIGFGIG